MTGYRIVALTVSSALFMQYLDSSALYTAIPAIARDFGVPAVDLNLAILSYQLAKGIALIGPAIFTLMFGLESLANPHVGWLTPALLGAGLVLSWLFIRHAGSAPAPVLDLSLFRIASYCDSITSACVLRTVAGASGFILPLWFQLGMGMSAARAGALMVASAAGVVLSRLVGVRLTQMVHPRNVAIGGAALMVVALLISARMAPDWPLPAFCLALALQAVTVSAAMMVLRRFAAEPALGRFTQP